MYFCVLPQCTKPSFSLPLFLYFLVFSNIVYTSSSIHISISRQRIQIPNKSLYIYIESNIQEKEENNLSIRLKEIEKIVNNNCPNGSKQFRIPREIFAEFVDAMQPEIFDHTRVHATKIKTKINDENQYRKPARNMLNRWKPAILGNHVLHKVIFFYLYNVCDDICFKAIIFRQFSVFLHFSETCFASSDF